MSRFPKDARVCFIGDSITHGHHFVARVADFYHQNFLADNINFYNAGTSGASVGTALAQFDLDVTPVRPTHAVIMLGVNDSGRDRLANGRSMETFAALERNFTTYKARMNLLLGRLEAMGVEITLCTPVPMDEYTDFGTQNYPGCYALMLSYAEHIRNVARARGYALCDYFAYLTKVMQTETIFREDRVHPAPLGHYYMAKCLLASQGLDYGGNRPVPAYLTRWNQLVGHIRDLRAAEYMMIRAYDLPTEEALAVIREKIAEPGLREYFVNMGKHYLEYKPQEEALQKELIYEMEIRLKDPTQDRN